MMIKKLVQLLVLAFRYLVNMATLCVSVFMRYRIGSDSYAPWSWLPHGEGEGLYAPGGWMRFWFVFATFIWIRLFMVITIATQSSAFDSSQWSEWEGLLQGFWTLSHFGSEVYAIGSGSGFFYILSFAFVIVALLQLLISEEILERYNWNPNMDTLGRSGLFFLLIKRFGTGKREDETRRLKHVIRGTLEPFVLGLIGVVFYFLNFPVHACFFGISAAAMAFQAHYRRSKERRARKELVGDIKEREKALEELKLQVKKTSRSASEIELDGVATPAPPVRKR